MAAVLSPSRLSVAWADIQRHLSIVFGLVSAVGFFFGYLSVALFAWGLGVTPRDLGLTTQDYVTLAATWLILIAAFIGFGMVYHRLMSELLGTSDVVAQVPARTAIRRRIVVRHRRSARDGEVATVTHYVDHFRCCRRVRLRVGSGQARSAPGSAPPVPGGHVSHRDDCRYVQVCGGSHRRRRSSSRRPVLDLDRAARSRGDHED